MSSREERLRIADEIIWRIDTVTLATPQEVDDIRCRALAGEFDDIFSEEELLRERLQRR